MKFLRCIGLKAAERNLKPTHAPGWFKSRFLYCRKVYTALEFDEYSKIAQLRVHGITLG
jgi:hypothetical protein